jgi:preprotein translocase subunit YajC
MASIAWAADAAPAGGGIAQFIPLVLIFVVFYFLLIRPQQKKVKEHQELVANLKRGDAVVTSGGVYGEITGMTDTVITLEIADNVRIKVARGHIAGKQGAVNCDDGACTPAVGGG